MRLATARILVVEEKKCPLASGGRGPFVPEVEVDKAYQDGTQEPKCKIQHVRTIRYHVVGRLIEVRGLAVGDLSGCVGDLVGILHHLVQVVVVVVMQGESFLRHFRNDFLKYIIF